MDIDFALEKEPLDKLVKAYIQAQQNDSKLIKSAQIQKKSILLLNSILINLSSQHKGLSELTKQIKYCLDVNSGDRDCLRRGAQLISQVIRKSQSIVNKTEKEGIIEIVNLCIQKAFITICGNDFIYLMELISSKIDLQSQQSNIIQQLIYQFTTNNKLQINSYRQQTRLCLYKILLRLLINFNESTLQWLKAENKDKKFMERCIRAGDGEKDPRNIGNVFELYLKTLQLFSHQDIEEYKTAMFQNIESYYPIEFVGDQDNHEHQRINIPEITFLLDKCLCHPFFLEQTWELLSVKTAAPPIAKFTPTLTLFIDNIIKSNQRKQFLWRLKSVLLRYCEQQFLEEQYGQDDQGLGQVIVKLVQVIFCNSNDSYTEESYGIIVHWLQVMLKRLRGKEGKCAGTVIAIFRKIINKHSTSKYSTFIQLFRSFALQTILRSLNAQEAETIPLLGLAIVSVSSLTHITHHLNESIALLIFTVGNLYAQTSDQIKMLILKILLQIYRNCPSNRAMIRKVNDGYIFKDCLSRAKESFKTSLNPIQVYFVKAFIDFVASVYLNELEQIANHMETNHHQLQTYLLCRLWQNLQHGPNQENYNHNQYILVDCFKRILLQITNQDQKQAFLKGLKILNVDDFLLLIFSFDWQNGRKLQPKLLFSIVIELRQYFIKYCQELPSNFTISKESFGTINHLIYQFILQRTVPSNHSQQQRLWAEINHPQQKDKIVFPQITNLGLYDSNSHTIIQQCFSAYPATYTHWVWQNVKKIDQQGLRKTKISQILKYLPEKLLMRDSQSILSILLHDPKLSTSLVKITQTMPTELLKSNGILSYCLQYLQELSQGQQQQKSTQRNACILSILINVLEKDKSNEAKGEFYKYLKAFSKLVVHRKRVVRQATRKLLSYLQY